MLQRGTSPDDTGEQRPSHSGDPVDGTNVGRLGESSAHLARSLPVGRHNPDDSSEYHGGISRLPQSHRQACGARVALHVHGECDNGHGEGRRRQAGMTLSLSHKNFGSICAITFSLNGYK